MQDAATMTIDRNDFEPIPQPQRFSPVCAINISASGQVTLNKNLLEAVRSRTGSLRLGFARHKQNSKILLLFPTDTPNYSFSACGTRRDREFSRSLVAGGIPLPARYIVEWNEEAGAWVGILKGELSKNALAQSLNGSRGRRKQ